MKNFPPLLDHQPPSSPLHRELVWWFNRSFIHIQWNTDEYVDSLRPGWGESPDAVTPSCPVALWSLGAAEKEEPLTALLFISLAPLLALLSEAIILGLCTSFLPHLRHVRMGNGRRSLQFSLVADLTCEVLLFYSGIIRLWEIYPYSLHTHSVIRAREVGSLHWAECSGLPARGIEKGRYSPGGLMSSNYSRAGSSRRWWRWRVKRLSVHILLFWQSKYSCLP